MSNNSITNATFTTASGSAVASQLIEELYSDYVFQLVCASSFTLAVYTTVLDIPREAKYMWLSSRPFTIPTLFYGFTRYGMLISQGIAFWVNFLPLSVCSILNDIQGAALFAMTISIEGILIIRAYALSEENKVIAGVLIFLLVGGLITSLYGAIVSSSCIEANFPPVILITDSIANILICITNILVFFVCLWKVWDTWKSKGESGIRHHNDIVSVLLKQTVSWFSAVIILGNTLTIFDLTFNTNAISILGSLDHSLSPILIASFTLDLRQQNMSVIQTADLALTTISFGGMVNYVHQSIIMEMSDHDNVDAMVLEGGDDDLPNALACWTANILTTYLNRIHSLNLRS